MSYLSNYTEHIVSENSIYNDRKQDMIEVFSMLSLVFIIIGFSIVISLIVGRFNSNIKRSRKCEKSE